MAVQVYLHRGQYEVPLQTKFYEVTMVTMVKQGSKVENSHIQDKEEEDVDSEPL